MEHVITTIFDYFLPILLGAVLGYLTSMVSSNKAERAMLRALGRYRIKDESHKCFDQGYVTPVQLDMLTDLHTAYNALKGNSVGDEYYNRVKGLRIEEGDEIEHER